MGGVFILFFYSTKIINSSQIVEILTFWMTFLKAAL